MVVLTNTCLETRGLKKFGIHCLAVRLVFLHGLSSFADCVLRQFSWQDQLAGTLNVSSTHGLLSAVFAQASSFCCNLFERIVHERIQDAHGLLRNSNFWVHLLQDFVHVNVVRLSSSASSRFARHLLCLCFPFVSSGEFSKIVVEVTPNITTNSLKYRIFRAKQQLCTLSQKSLPRKISLVSFCFEAGKLSWF